ncbi:gliding motility-associated ABC transporter substrate-binding protein GldG [Chitinophaga sancti]|uniref:Gliding motility-associated ABC transporter substrate-binding protein GldG n=1 Tax=Chitinophaga sancti TaxID=1004 RepID=A0A1K1SEF8_9BACT|nr:gliding motility-associated ABC transporter substrate-binding protein GldG [Chitinophaga sancti]WQD60001.1 gliding motility-associated ABC transporter substrate-binding protein GldG [Chitinophaga sancti]WQG87869.1 gliding motility-associated ABC transporter substrate-binding protein GldG [Chitinophaga sancti]SFW82678.1 gliding-associated putative ABC transporter substrate-binding component GldG [Chitinophaga sancti]
MVNSKKKYLQRAILVIAILIGVNILAMYVHTRWDLTAEKRFTLTPSTRQLLKGLDSTVTIEVFLKGDYPASFRQLAQSTQELLEEFREAGGNRVQFSFQNPGQGLNDSDRLAFQQSLAEQGIMPFNMQVQEDANQGYSEKLIFPGALVHYGSKTLGINLLKNQGGQDPMQTMNNSEALLEFQFANAIYQLKQNHLPLVGYMLGHHELLGAEVLDALTSMQSSYLLDTITLQYVSHIPQDFAAIVFAKPLDRFSDEDKLKIDQYVMNGGKVLWFVDELNVGMDSLQKHDTYVAMDRDLNLEDILFRYGVRINQDLIQDLQCDRLPQVVGHVGDKPQFDLLPFPYFPLLSPSGAHPIVKNMDLVLSHFASSIDTVKGGEVTKTVLLSSSANSKLERAPVQLSWNDLRVKPNPRQFQKHNLPVAVLLEGQFTSLFRNRLSAGEQQLIAQVTRKPFKDQSDFNKMIVVSDGDLITNAISQKNGPMQMGVNLFDPSMVYANKEFLLNSLGYLTNNAGIMEARNKELTLRLLDAEKIKQNKSVWQAICVIFPVLLILLFRVIFQFIRQRKFER